MGNTWIKKGFDEFRKGTFGNGGQNIYVSKKGTLQRIFNYDTNLNGYPDLPFANSQSMGERPPLKIFKDINNTSDFYFLPSNGSYDGLITDLNNDGFDDLVVACQNNGTHADVCAIIYYGSEKGLCENYKTELPVPDSTGVVSGFFKTKDSKSLCFISKGNLKIFDQNSRGFNNTEFYEIKENADAVAAADINGNGYDDLYVKRSDGSTLVYWGSEKGFTESNKTLIYEAHEINYVGATSTASRRTPYPLWRPCIININSNKYLFRGSKSGAIFYKYSDNCFTECMHFDCPNAKYAISDDFDNDGFQDLAVICSDNFDNIETSFIIWNNQNELGSDILKINTKAAVTASVAELNNSHYLVIAQTSDSVMRTTESQLIKFNGRKISDISHFETGETMKILFGHTDSSPKLQMVVIEHETGRVRGDENTYIYVGGEKGYNTDDRISLPGRSAVDMMMFDYNDDGRTDVLVSNCCENWADADPGSWLYINDKDGLNAQNRLTIPTVRNHGSAVGDFSHSGYLDIICGGCANREIRILHGGPWGYDEQHMDRIVFGPDPENYHPQVLNIYSDEPVFEPQEAAMLDKIGEMRWNYAADFNKDGWLDLFASVVGSGYGYIFWGGPEGFSIDRCTKLNCDGAICATAADLNKNGYLDLVIGCHMSASKNTIYETYIVIYWGSENGYQESRKTMLPVPCANSVTVGDFNGNGWLDVYATAYNNGRIRDLDSYLYINDHGNFSVNNRKSLFNHSGCGCLAGDFNGDGYTDLAVACHKDKGDHIGSSFIFWGGPDGLDDSRKTELPTVGPHGMSTVDPGNIMDRSDKEYYISEPHNTDADIAYMICKAECTSSSWYELSYRTADKESDLNLNDWIPVTENQKFKVSSTMQYRIALCAKCGCGTPRITEVSVIFD